MRFSFKNYKGFIQAPLLRKDGAGFTLIELLVSITIVAILATIGLTMYSGAQKSAKIAKRGEDLRAFKNALEIYYNASNSTYPSTFASGANPVFKSTGSLAASDTVLTSLVPKYLNAMIVDPSYGVNTANSYFYASNGTDYKLYVTTVPSEMSPADFQSQPALVDPKRDGSGDSCKVDSNGTPAAWAIWSSCDPDKCTDAESSCSW